MMMPDLNGDMFQLFLDASPDLYWVKDSKDRYVIANKALCDRILMCDHLHTIGKTGLFFLQSREQQGYDQKFEKTFMALDDQVRQSGMSGHFFEQGQIKGKSIALDIKISPVFDKSGQIIATLGCARDVTRETDTQQDQEKIQEQIIEKEKDALVCQVAGKLAHDFNNILGVIMGLSELARMESSSDTMSTYLDDILAHSQRGNNLTRNLILFAKDREPVLSFFKADDILTQVLACFDKRLEQIKTTIEIESDLPRLLADPEMVKIAISNLVCNAIHALSKSPDPCIEIRIFSSDQSFCFQIKDNGCGIPDQDGEKIFIPSYSLKGGRDQTCSYLPNIRGSGYGLCIVKKIMDKHQGTLSFKSEFGTGSVFVLSFPVILDTLTHHEIHESENIEIITNKRILLVEDEQVISQIQSRILSAKPFEHFVEIADSGETAMDLLARNSYDLISLDYMLPGSFNGIDVYKYIRKQNHKIPVLFVSGNIEFIESLQPLRKNDRYMAHQSKPCGNFEYAKVVNQLLLTAE